MKGPLVLCVLDGFGLAEPGPGNAVRLARTPTFDRMWAEAPRTTLVASGPAVGLPEGQMGNSEVGHLNLGAGRVVRQSLTYIQSVIDDGTFSENPVLNRLCREVARDGRALHLLGLVSRGGVHSDLPHLLAVIDLALRAGVGEILVHAFTDGRDAPPDSGRGALRELQAHLDRAVSAPTGGPAAGSGGLPARIATVVGRYFAMDRDARWDRTKRAHDAVVCGLAEHRARSADDAITSAYARGETDEFVRPTVVVPDGSAPARIEDGDGVFWFNFRADRARQLSHALLGDPAWDRFERCAAPRVRFASLMRYDRELDAPFALAMPEVRSPLGEVLAAAGLRQYRTAETEKYPHVTYFFNAMIEAPYPGEERWMAPSPKVATYDLQPEMSAEPLTDATVARLRDGDDAFVLINYANPDMVGHTGVLAAAITACEVVDACLARLERAVLERGGCLLVVADHGNAEQMLEPDGSPHTAHTTNPVPFVLVGGPDGVRLADGGMLGDVAPTVLDLLELRQPDAMTGRSLLIRPGGARAAGP